MVLWVLIMMIAQYRGNYKEIWPICLRYFFPSSLIKMGVRWAIVALVGVGGARNKPGERFGSLNSGFCWLRSQRAMDNMQPLTVIDSLSFVHTVSCYLSSDERFRIALQSVLTCGITTVNDTQTSSVEYF